MSDSAIRGEEDLIQSFLAPLTAGMPGAFGLTDDCAALMPPQGEDLVLKTDAVAAGVHFFVDDAPADIGWKALAVNASDLAAKGARPLAYLMSLAFPDAPTRGWMADFARGLGDAQAAFGCQLAGGDTDRRPGPLSITIAILGAVPAGRMVRRGTARPGDRLFVTGTLGDAALGLALRQGISLPGLGPADRAFLLDRYLRPQPRLAAGPALRAHASAAMDLSDGLVKDLGRLCKSSGVGARVAFERVPVSPAGRAVLSVEAERAAAIVAAGDDYELLVTVPPANASAFSADTAARGVAVTEIGEVTAGQAVVIVDTRGNPMTFERSGWDHF